MIIIIAIIAIMIVIATMIIIAIIMIIIMIIATMISTYSSYNDNHNSHSVPGQPRRDSSPRPRRPPWERACRRAVPLPAPGAPEAPSATPTPPPGGRAPEASPSLPFSPPFSVPSPRNLTGRGTRRSSRIPALAPLARGSPGLARTRTDRAFESVARLGTLGPRSWRSAFRLSCQQREAQEDPGRIQTKDSRRQRPGWMRLGGRGGRGRMAKPRQTRPSTREPATGSRERQETLALSQTRDAGRARRMSKSSR